MSLFFASSRPRFFAIFCLIFLLNSVLLWKVGPARVAKDAFWYAEAAERLVACHFNYREYFGSVSSSIPPVFYIVFVTLVALCRALLGSHWLTGVLLLNLSAVALTGALLADLISRLTRRVAAVWITLFLYVICADIFSWARYVLTDTLFMAEAFALFYFIARAFLDDVPQRAKQHWVIAAVLLCVSPFFRPTGLILLAPSIAAFGLWLWRRAAVRREEPLRLHPALWGGLIFLLISFSVANAWFMQDLTRWPWPAASGPLRLTYYAKLYHEGCIVNDRPYTFVAPPSALLGYLAISARRLLYFFSFWVPVGFSRSHNFVMACFFVPAYGLALVAICGVLRRRALERADLVVLLACLMTATFAVFHAHTEVDYDWRYRLPILPPLILLAGMGAAALLNRQRSALLPTLKLPHDSDEAESEAEGARSIS